MTAPLTDFALVFKHKRSRMQTIRRRSVTQPQSFNHNETAVLGVLLTLIVLPVVCLHS